MDTYSKTDLIRDLAKRFGTPQSATGEIVDAIFETITTRTDAGDKVAIKGFGSFTRKETAARMGRNPRTGEPVEIQASSRLTFKASKTK